MKIPVRHSKSHDIVNIRHLDQSEQSSLIIGYISTSKHKLTYRKLDTCANNMNVNPIPVFKNYSFYS